MNSAVWLTVALLGMTVFGCAVEVWWQFRQRRVLDQAPARADGMQVSTPLLRCEQCAAEDMPMVTVYLPSEKRDVWLCSECYFAELR